MFADTMEPQGIQRAGMTRRVLLGRTALLSATSALALALNAAGPVVSARRQAGKKGQEKPREKKQGAGKSSPAQAEAKEISSEKKGKTVTRTFSSSNAVVINDDTTADPYPATIQVSGFKKGTVVDVNVVLRGLNHGYPDNIDAVLVAPSGASTTLMSDTGGSTNAASLTLTIDDEAAGALPDSTALTNGAYRPANYGAIPDTYPSVGAPPVTAALSLLDGGNPNGEWRLYVLDDTALNLGAISGGWDLVLTVKLAKKKKGGRGKH